MTIQISDWDTNHFGLKIAKLPYSKNRPLQEGIEESIFNNVKLLITRCPTNDFKRIHELEEKGFQLMDTLIFHSIDLTNFQIPETKYPARAAITDDIPSVRNIARESFKGYISHFGADPKLDKKKCDELYELWAVNSFHDKNLADHVIVIEIEEKVSAFLTIKIKDRDKTGETILCAVHPSIRRQAVYTNIIMHGLKWIRSQGCTKFESSTQITNIPIHKARAKLGASIDRSYYTFHLWI